MKTNSLQNERVYLPGLNGLRAIAALAVVLSHITIQLEDFGLNDKIFGTDKEGNALGIRLAGHGVTVSSPFSVRFKSRIFS